MEVIRVLAEVLWQETEPDCHLLYSLVQNPVILNDIYILSTALFMAVHKGFSNSVRILLEAGASPYTTFEGNGGSLLHVCCGYKQRTEIVRELLKHGADVNAEDSFKLTPLHVASSYECVENMQELLKNGATVDALDVYGKTPLLLAAIARSGVSTLQVLLRAGADINLCNENGCAPLHAAVETCSPQIVRFLLQHNADANVRDIEGRTPLHIVAYCTQKSIELIRELLKFGARMNELNNKGQSPLYFAIDLCNKEATQDILSCGSPFDLDECLKALVIASYSHSHKIRAITKEIIRYVFIKNPDSLVSIRQQLMQESVNYTLRKLSTFRCNLGQFKHDCLAEVEVLSETSCDCGKSSIWGSINNFEECDCETQQAILKFLFSGRHTNFGDAFFYKLNKEFLLDVTLNLLSYFKFKESKKILILPWVCRKEIERYVSFEDIVSFQQNKQSEINFFEFEKFMAFIEGKSSFKSISELSPSEPKRHHVISYINLSYLCFYFAFFFMLSTMMILQK